MLAGLEVVLGSTVREERGSPAGWAWGFRGSSTFTSYLTTFVYLTVNLSFTGQISSLG